MDHPIIKRFEATTELLQIQGDNATLDDAIVRLAAWMNLAANQLTDDDMAVLVGIGALLYRDGLARRNQ